MTPEPRSIIDGKRPRSRRTAGNRFSFRFCCQISSVTVINPPLGAADPPTLNHDVDSLKAIQDFVDHLCCAFSGRDIRLDKVVIRLFRRGGTRGYDDDCSTLLETVGNRLACALW